MTDNPELYPLFEKLFREYYNTLANYALSIVKNREDAEDVVQDVFIKLWQTTPQVIRTDQVKFYLYAATKNTCISLLRKQAGKTFVQADTISLPSSESAIKPENTDPGAAVQKALSLLPPQCLVIFKLSRFGNLTYQQIADELGLSVKTVENQMGKALRIMRDFAKQHNISFAVLQFILLAELYPKGLV